MKYLSFVRSSEKFRNVQPPAALQEAMGKLIERFTKEGALVDTGGLAPSREGFRMRLENGTLTTIDGPFIESKEVIGGWAILQADSRAEILRRGLRMAAEALLADREPGYSFEELVGALGDDTSLPEDLSTRHDRYLYGDSDGDGSNPD